MTAYTIWREADGTIARAGYCSPLDVEKQANKSLGEALYEGEALSDQSWSFDKATRLPIMVSSFNDGDRAYEINKERMRRINVGAILNGVYVRGGEEDTRNLLTLALAAQLRIATGDLESTITYRDGLNTDHLLSPMGVINLWKASAAYVSDLYQASWLLKAYNPIPTNVSEDSYWPPRDLPEGF